MQTEPHTPGGEVESHRRTAMAYYSRPLTTRHLKHAKRRAKASKPAGLRPKKIALRYIMSVVEVPNGYPFVPKVVYFSPAIISTQGRSSTLHRRASLAKDGFIPPLAPEEKAQVAQEGVRVKEGLSSFPRLHARSHENQQTEDGFQQGSVRVMINQEAITKRLTPDGERFMDQLVEARKPPLENWEEPPEYEKD